jgi:hypothetical protein
MSQIKCADGGDLKSGESFTFINEHDEACTLGGYSEIFTLDTNPIPAKTESGPGTSGATLLALSKGDYEYTASCRKKRGNPKISVGAK